MRARAALLLLAVGCGSPSPDPEPVPAPGPDPGAPAPSEPDPEPAPAAEPVTAGSPVKVELDFFGVGALYRGFFSTPDAVATLGADLGDCLGQTAQVWISYDSVEFVGQIKLKVPPGASACLPVENSGALDLSPLVPLTTALARYRDQISSTFDYRVASFHLGLLFTRGTHTCQVWAVGQHPPDGTRFGPCPELNGVRTCAAGNDDEGVTSLRFSDAADQRFVRECFTR